VENVGVTITGVRLDRAVSSDTDILTESQLHTFDDDARRFPDERFAGPTGYRSPAWNRTMIANACYYKVELNGAVVGGLVVLRQDWSHFHIPRIWVDSAHQSRGLGSRALALAEARFPQATLWTVDVPSWAHRRRHFFKANGYQAAYEANGTVRYEKHRRGILRLRSLP
jgi:ribosomal protein S18 acetylase RimI-like enzyme